MSKTTLRIMVFVLAFVFISIGVYADSVSFDGTVVNTNTYEIYAPIGGTVGSVPVKVGQRVKAGDVLASLKTTKVFAPESGTITGVFGEIGDSCDTITNRYGSVISIEGTSKYQIAASTSNAYNSTSTKFVHVGEKVYLSCYSDGNHTGWGVITSVNGTDYTVEVTDGNFLIDESVNVFRGSSATASRRVGRGKISRMNPTGVNGSGSIVSIAVSSGDNVKKGDLLFETLNGTFDGYYMSGNDIYTDIDGIISELKVTQGSNIDKNGVVAVLYPTDTMRIKGSISEYDLSDLHVGDTVSIELSWNQDDGIKYPGTVSMISAVADSEAGGASTDTTFTVYIDFTPDEQTRFGMSAVIVAGEDEEDVKGDDENSEAVQEDDEAYYDDDIEEEPIVYADMSAANKPLPKDNSEGSEKKRERGKGSKGGNKTRSQDNPDENVTDELPASTDEDIPQVPEEEIPQFPEGEFPEGEFPQFPDGEFPDEGEFPQFPDGEFPGMTENNNQDFQENAAKEVPSEQKDKD